MGVDLAEAEKEVEAPQLTEQDKLSIAPAGSDLGELKDEQEVVVPDISHLSIDKG